MMSQNLPPSSDRAHHLLDRTAHKITHHGMTVSLRLVLSLIGLIFVGTVVLMLPSMAVGERLTFTEAIFTSTSALTVTGLSLITPAVDLTFAGKIVLLILIQIGGVGFMFVSVILLQLLGRRILLKDRLALTTSLGLDSPAEILGLLRRVFMGVLLIEGSGAFLLWLNWLRYFSPMRALGYAVFHSISSFCNAGFDLFNGVGDKNGVDFAGIPTDNISLAIMGTLILVGGLGIPVIGELLLLRKKMRFSVNTRVTLWVVMGLTLFGWLGLFLSESFGAGVLADAPWDERLLRTLFQSISNRTAGFAGMPAFNILRPASILLIMAMMLVGCAPASMGGGITTGTFSVLIVNLVSYVRGQKKPQVFGRSIDQETRRRAGVILTISMMLVASATWLILMTHSGLTLDQAFFEVVSAFATCGLSLGVTGELNGFGRLIIMAMMFWGRLGPLTVVIATAQRRRNTPRLIRYPEEQILIG